MPGFDGTGPRGAGPLTGRGEGYCAVQLPDPTTGQTAVGFRGLSGTPVRLNDRVALRTLVRPRQLFGLYPWRGSGRGRRWSAGRRRGGRFGVRRW